MSRQPTGVQLQSHEEIILYAEEYVNCLHNESIPTESLLLHPLTLLCSLSLLLCKVAAGMVQIKANTNSSQVRCDIDSFDSVQNELTVTSDGRLLYRGTRLFVPRSLELRVMKVAHASHLGF